MIDRVIHRPCAGAEKSLAACAEPLLDSNKSSPSACQRARFAVRAILVGLARGDTDENIKSLYRQRFSPRKPVAIDLSKSPCRGPTAAPALLVVSATSSVLSAARPKRSWQKLSAMLRDQAKTQPDDQDAWRGIRPYVFQASSCPVSVLAGPAYRNVHARWPNASSKS
jgi:hypothetical protein